jgi:hypothetical protein
MFRTQLQKSVFWIDEAGNSISSKDLKKKERVIEQSTGLIVKEAIRANKALVAFHNVLKAQVDRSIQAILSEYSGKKTEFKGNYTLYNFDRSIKIMVKVSQPIKFDEITISQAKAKLDEFLSGGISAKTSFIKQMVMDAFSQQSGNMDTKKVMGLKRYADRINEPLYVEAMKLIDEAIRRPESATYYQVWTRNDEGKYDVVKLNLSDF